MEYVHNVGTQFYFRTTLMAPNQRLVMIDLTTFDGKNPTKKSVVDVIPEH
jgi:hypothetical protein